MIDFRATAANPPCELKKLGHAMGFVTRALTLSFVLINIAPPPASAQASDPSHLTSRGRVMVGGSVGGHWSNDDVAEPWQLYDKWRLYARPSATLFVRDHIGIGASLGSAFLADASVILITPHPTSRLVLTLYWSFPSPRMSDG